LGAVCPVNCGWVGSGDAAGEAGPIGGATGSLLISTTDPAIRRVDRTQIGADTVHKAHSDL
jgi:hypothetical protein